MLGTNKLKIYGCTGKTSLVLIATSRLLSATDQADLLKGADVKGNSIYKKEIISKNGRIQKILGRVPITFLTFFIDLTFSRCYRKFFSLTYPTISLHSFN